MLFGGRLSAVMETIPKHQGQYPEDDQLFYPQAVRLLEESTTHNPTPTHYNTLFKYIFVCHLHSIFALESTVAGTTTTQTLITHYHYFSLLLLFYYNLLL